MSWVKRVSVTVTTDAAGAATGYTEAVNGTVSAIEYTKVDFDNGSTITVSQDRSGETIWTEANVNASAIRRPRAATHSTAGAAALYAAGGAAVNDKIAVVDSRIKVVIASGGNTKTGTFTVVLE